jgi:divalent metal cation (Fe/Co/Zn/Cd) transporter
VVGVSFCLLALYILQEAFGMILFGERPEKSIIGIVLAILSIILMPILGILKFRLSVKLGSRALRADSMETFICAYLSLNLLAGLFLNALSGLWWADPVAALLMLPFVIKEGISALREGKEGFI